jgi:hypothetical protein
MKRTVENHSKHEVLFFIYFIGRRDPKEALLNQVKRGIPRASINFAAWRRDSGMTHFTGHNLTANSTPTK